MWIRWIRLRDTDDFFFFIKIRDADPAYFSSLTFEMLTKTNFLFFLFMMVHLHCFSKTKKSKRSHKAVGNRVFLTILA
jgi:hypothetical protein